MTFLSLLMIEVGLLSVTGDRMSTEYWLNPKVMPAQEKCG